MLNKFLFKNDINVEFGCLIVGNIWKFKSLKGFVWMNMYLVVGKFFVVLNIVWFEEYLVNEFINSLFFLRNVVNVFENVMYKRW